MTNKHVNEARNMLETVLRNAGATECAESAFVEWPELEAISMRFLRFVSPWLIVNDQNLAEVTLKEAFAALEHNNSGQKDFPHRCFMESITHCVEALASVRISVMSVSGLWEIWSYDEPLLSWMDRMGKSAMQIRSRDTIVEQGPLLIKLLAYISSTRDMQMAEISFATPSEIFHK